MTVRMQGGFMRRKIQRFSLKYIVICVAVLIGALLTTQVSLAARENAKKGSQRELIMLCPGGSAFGVKMMIDGVIVAGTAEISEGGKVFRPAYDGGLREKDIITKINGETVKRVIDVTSAIEHSEGKPLTFTCTREGKQIELKLKPIYSHESEKYKLGIWVRDNTAGIGTMTYIRPEDGTFGGLGHGIYDIDTGELLPLSKGIVTNVGVTGIVKGMAGKPGEIRGYLKQNKIGVLFTNCDCGVFGVLTPAPEVKRDELMPIAYKDEVKNGPATIRCTLDSEGVKEYNVEILNINYQATGTKCFTVKVTDEALIEKTGGIVQGMSGSPIIQNGRLVGAVTHVMVANSTEGYGIFIENMLNASINS